MGETERRLHALSAWRETPFFKPREHFSDAELVDLAIGVIAINGWNRMAIAFALPVGNYKPAVKAA